MTTRERFHAVMNFREFDRLPLVEWASWWDATIARWHTEGLPASLHDRYALYRHFGLEQYQQYWMGPAIPPAATHGGAVVASMEEYRRLRDTLYAPPSLDHAALAQMAERQARGEVVYWCTVLGFFWFPRTLLGIEEHLYAFYDAPELLHQMNEDLLAWNLRLLDAICAVCTPDFVTIAEDMSYNHGAMLSRNLFETFLQPYYRRLIPALRERGILPIVDSDGDVTELACWLEEVGVAGILPLERQAGVDIVQLRADHPTMRFIGHYDKMAMLHDEAAMRAEFERLLPTARQGGFLISVDHQTPPGVSLQNYECYLRLFTEYARKAAE
jgi:hypothetical protein